MIKLKVGDTKFLEKFEKYKDKHYELVSPSGCGFQDAQTFEEWIEPCTPEKLHKIAMEHPNTRVRLSLVSNHKKWYSIAKIKNLQVRIWE